MNSFKQIQRDLQRAINHGGGLDKVPLSDDALRPLAMALVDIGKDAGNLLTTFQIGDTTGAGPIYLGFIASLGEAAKLKQDIALGAAARRLVEQFEASGPTIELLGHGQAAIYFKRLFIVPASLRPN